MDPLSPLSSYLSPSFHPLSPHPSRFPYNSSMPTYVYQVINADGSEGEIFEVVQRMSEPHLTMHPENGLPVRRIIMAPNLPLKWSDQATKGTLSDKNLNRMGFTK